MAEALRRELRINPGYVATAQHDVLDAALCIVAGLDFVEGASYPPEDLQTAEREGWIWVRRVTEPE